MFIVKIVNGSIKEPKDQKQLEEYNKGKYEFQDSYISEQTKESTNFMNSIPNIRKAQLFNSKEQAQGIVSYMQAINLETGKEFEVVVEELVITSKGVK